MRNVLQTQTWIEPFSRREIEILRLISDGLSNHEISQKLLLSPETIKWYNKQIFSKLGAKSRTQAVKLAEAFGLFESQGLAEIEGESRQSSNLPYQISSFVGRKKEIADIKGLLKSSRLVVLTGPGGCGKSRLASQVAAELIEVYRDGVWLVEFASICEPALVANAIVQALQVNASGDPSLEDVLKRFLARKHLLLLLDNMEHLPDAYPMVGRLLAAAPQLAILATSRERLHIYGEQEYTVHPLSLPEQNNKETREQLLAYEAIDLFVQRARAVQSGFEVNDVQLASIAHICTRLDGLPLAIELAASMVKTHPLPLLAQRLDGSLNALLSGPRDLPARQRTLRTTLDWSYQLLKQEEKILFARLAVFRGGGTLEAIKAICTGGFKGDPIEILSALVEKNVIYHRQDPDGELRFTLLQTIHEYATERLSGSGEAENIQVLHADYFTRLVEVAEDEILSAKQDYWFAHLRAEKDNLHSVFLWSFSGNEIEFGLRLAAALRNYWFYNGLAAEGRHWTDLGIEKSLHAAPALRAGVLLGAGQISLALSDMGRGKQLLYQALDLYQRLGDERSSAWSMIFLGSLFVEDPHEIPQGIDICTQGLALFCRLDDKPGIAQAFNILGELARLQGDDEAARHYYEQSLIVANATGERQREAIIYNNMSFIAYHQQDYRLALQFAQRSLIIAREQNSDYRQACFLATCTGPIAALGLPERAIQLLGASHARFEALGTLHQPADQYEIDLFISTVHNLLGEKVFQEAWQAGLALTLQDAVSLALTEMD